MKTVTVELEQNNQTIHIFSSLSYDSEFVICFLSLLKATKVFHHIDKIPVPLFHHININVKQFDRLITSEVGLFEASPPLHQTSFPEPSIGFSSSVATTKFPNKV